MMNEHDPDRARSALLVLDPGVPRDEWVRVGMAFKAAGGDFETFHSWSANADNYRNENDCATAWRSFREDGPITARTLFAKARETRWQDDHQYQGGQPTKEQIKRQRQQREDAMGQADADREAAYAKAALKARATVRAAAPAEDAFAYLKMKGIRTQGALQRNNQLVLPVCDEHDNIMSVQFINAGGRKRFLPGGKKSGGRFWLGDPAGADVLVLAEGFATAASLREATSWPVACCFDAGNLSRVAITVREQFPSARIIIAGDDDRHSKTNTGRKQANEAARIAAGIAVFPHFDGPEGTDWNDLHAQLGLDSVREQIHKAFDQHEPTKHQLAAADTSTGIAFKAPGLAAADVRDGTATTRPLTEHGNALRLFDLAQNRIRYVPEVQAWLVWHDGWQWDRDGAEIRMAATKLSARIYTEGSPFCLDHATHFVKWARQSQSLRTVQATVQLLADHRPIRLAMHLIDADPLMVGYDGARRVIDLRTGVHRPAVNDDYITKSLAASEVGDAKKAVRWMAFLDQIFQGDDELIDWMQRWIGYTLTGSTSEQIMVFCFGPGQNGKSVFGEFLRWLAGDYSCAIPVETLSESRRQAGGASPDLVNLVGARIGITTETEDGRALAETLVKGLVAGDAISARPLYGKPFTFLPQFKLMVLGNHRPVIKGTDHGIWRRIRLVPFDRIFSDEEKDTRLLDKLKAEAPHILAWAVKGCIEWQRRGLADTPRVVANETAEYRTEQDIIGQWLGECTTRDSGGEVNGTDLYASYRAWSIRNGLMGESKISFGRRLRERGLRNRPSNGQKLWRGLTLKPRASCD